MGLAKLSDSNMTMAAEHMEIPRCDSWHVNCTTCCKTQRIVCRGSTRYTLVVIERCDMHMRNLSPFVSRPETKSRRTNANQRNLITLI
uniref:Uncharacterized protein n=1 Tax=Physcomitrium patens TaxID=3218 RepID=A0A2K1IH25_PHYPA|nr:hypothetical protein PHYPA_029160 [Physcomitrium patens]